MQTCSLLRELCIGRMGMRGKWKVAQVPMRVYPDTRMRLVMEYDHDGEKYEHGIAGCRYGL